MRSWLLKAVFKPAYLQIPKDLVWLDMINANLPRGQEESPQRLRRFNLIAFIFLSERLAFLPREHKIVKDVQTKNRKKAEALGARKTSFSKIETPRTKQTFANHCFHLYCTFLQKPENSTWPYSSLFFSSLEMRMKPELVWGESRTCRFERRVLLRVRRPAPPARMQK